MMISQSSYWSLTPFEADPATGNEVLRGLSNGAGSDSALRIAGGVLAFAGKSGGTTATAGARAGLMFRSSTADTLAGDFGRDAT